MTVAELIAELQKYEPEAEVAIFDEYCLPWQPQVHTLISTVSKRAIVAIDMGAEVDE